MITQRAINLIKEFEGFRAKAYPDPGSGGEPITIGYGTTARAGVGITPKIGMTITEAEAEGYLRKTIDKFSAEIAPLITAPINENEFGAFVSLAYNIGTGAFRKSSALRYFNAGDKAAAADAILMWNKAGGKVMKGLIRRREAERALFLTPASHVNETPKSEHDRDDVLTPTPKPTPPVATKPVTLPPPAKPIKAPSGGAVALAMAIIAAIAAWLGWK